MHASGTANCSQLHTQQNQQDQPEAGADITESLKQVDEYCAEARAEQDAEKLRAAGLERVAHRAAHGDDRADAGKKQRQRNRKAGLDRPQPDMGEVPSRHFLASGIQE